jgi:hypothetical protein
MKHHDAINHLVDAERALVQARELCATAGVIDLINTAYHKIWTAGDLLYPDIMQQVRKEKIDPTG